MSDTQNKTENLKPSSHSEDERSSHSPPHSPTRNRYAILMETSGEECESWYYFIKYEGNEKNLRALNKVLESIEWYVVDNLSTFDLELEYLVSEQTAKEMTKVDLNHTSHHRKFDGTLKPVVFKFKKKDSNEKRMARIGDVLSYGQIEDYIDKEDIDPEDLTDASSSNEEEEEEESESESSEEEEKNDRPKKKKGIPPALMNSDLPRFAKAKRRQRKH